MVCRPGRFGAIFGPSVSGWEKCGDLDNDQSEYPRMCDQTSLVCVSEVPFGHAQVRRTGSPLIARQLRVKSDPFLLRKASEVDAAATVSELAMKNGAWTCPVE